MPELGRLAKKHVFGVFAVYVSQHDDKRLGETSKLRCDFSPGLNWFGAEDGDCEFSRWLEWQALNLYDITNEVTVVFLPRSPVSC